VGSNSARPHVLFILHFLSSSAALATFVRRLMAEAGYSLSHLAGEALRVRDRSASTFVGAIERLFLFGLWSQASSTGEQNA
jgi:hypothetical protein